MLVVLGIVATLFSLAIGAYLSWGRNTAVSTASQGCITTLDLARQWAVTHRTPAIIDLINDGKQGTFTISGITDGSEQPRLITSTNALPDGIVFSDTTPETITFHPDGSAQWEPEDPLYCDIIMREYGVPEESAMAATVTVSRLTGYIGINP